jgi:ribose-phosphate pyrophosphokinase
MIVLGSDRFAENLAKDVGVSFIAIEKRRFNDGEVCPRIMGEVDNHAIIAERMAIPTKPNRYLVEILLTIKNLKALGVEKIDVVVPYFVYGRQDKVFRKGEPFSAKFVLELLKSAGASRFFTVSSHADRESERISLSPIPAYNVNGFDVIGSYFKKMNLDNPVVAGADSGSEKFAKTVADVIGCDYHTFDKKRDRDTGKISMSMKFSAKDKDLIIVDDIVSSGGTMLSAIELAKEASSVYCSVVHVVSDESIEKISDEVERFVACDTIDSSISNIQTTGMIAKKILR